MSHSTSPIQTQSSKGFDSSLDEQLISMWVHGKSPRTQDYYRRYAHQFLAFLNKPLALATLADVQEFDAKSAERGLRDSSRGAVLAAVKSLLTFGNKSGILKVNVGIMVATPKSQEALSERILAESDVLMMIRLEKDIRNSLILKLLYAAGLRVSELCQLQWKDFRSKGDLCHLTVLGKGNRIRVILLPASVWTELQKYKKKTKSEAEDPVFASRKRGLPLTRARVTALVKEAAQRAGIPENVSSHWLRHAHASHSLERGAPIHLVQATLGHANVATTGRYLHAKPTDSSARYLPL